MKIIKEPVLAYNNSSGHSGSDTSEARANYLDRSGKTLTNQERILDLLLHSEYEGMTNAEFKLITGMDHSPSSSSFSNLHKDGRIARLSEVRRGSHPYVLPEFVAGRPTQFPGQIGNRVTLDVREYIRLMKIAGLYTQGGNK